MSPDAIHSHVVAVLGAQNAAIEAACAKALADGVGVLVVRYPDLSIAVVTDKAIAAGTMLDCTYDQLAQAHDLALRSLAAVLAP